MMKIKKILAAVSFSLAACVVLSSFSSAALSVKSAKASTKSSQMYLIPATNASKLPATAKNRKGTLVIGTAQLTGVFQQLYASSADDYHVSVPCSGASLLNNNDKGEMVNGTAHLAISNGGKTYTFKLLYKDKYSNGDPVKVQDYVNYYKVLADKSYDGYYNSIMAYNVVGSQAYHDGKASKISGITTPNSQTLVIKLSKPNASAIYALGGAYPISTKLYGKYIKHGSLKSFENHSMINFVTNGAYVLKSYKPNQYATLKANDNYFEGKPKIKNIIVKVVPEGEELQAVTTGSVDIDDEVTCNADDVTLGKKAGFVNMWVQPTLGYGWVGLNHKSPLFASRTVRQALLYAIDRKGLVEKVYGKYAHVQNIHQTLQSWLYTSEGVDTYAYNLKKAASLLAQAGWKKGSDGILTKNGHKFSFVFTATKGNAVTDVLIPLMMQAYKKLGIDMQAEYVDWTTLQNKFQNKTYDMSFMAWGLTADPDDSYIYSSNGSENFLNYSNKTVDKWYTQALNTVDDNKRKSIYQAIYRLLNKDLADFVIYQRSDCVAYNTRIKNFKCSPYCPIYYWYNKYTLAK